MEFLECLNYWVTAEGRCCNMVSSTLSFDFPQSHKANAGTLLPSTYSKYIFEGFRLPWQFGDNVGHVSGWLHCFCMANASEILTVSIF